MQAHGKLEGSIGRLEGAMQGLQNQLDRIEKSIEKTESEVQGHGKWMHTLKVAGGFVTAMMLWIFVNGVWPWLKAKLSVP